MNFTLTELWRIGVAGVGRKKRSEMNARVENVEQYEPE